MSNPTLYMTEGQLKMFHEAMVRYVEKYDPKRETIMERNFMSGGVSVPNVPISSLLHESLKTWRHIDIASTEQIRIGKIKKITEKDYMPSSITITPFACIQNMVHFQQLRNSEKVEQKKSISI